MHSRWKSMACPITLSLCYAAIKAARIQFLTFTGQIFSHIFCIFLLFTDDHISTVSSFFQVSLNLPYQRHYKALHIIWQLLIVNWVIICWFFSGFQFVLEYKGRKVFGKRKSFPLHRLLLYKCKLQWMHILSTSSFYLRAI